MWRLTSEASDVYKRQQIDNALAVNFPGKLGKIFLNFFGVKHNYGIFTITLPSSTFVSYDETLLGAGGANTSPVITSYCAP